MNVNWICMTALKASLVKICPALTSKLFYRQNKLNIM